MILYSKWLALSLSTRQKIAEQFGIIKKGSTHVVDNHIQSDGYSVVDIETAITVDALKLHLGMMQENDINVLWQELVARMEGKIPEVVKPAPLITGILPPEEAKQFKREYKKRKKDANKK